MKNKKQDACPSVEAPPGTITSPRHESSWQQPGLPGEPPNPAPNFILFYFFSTFSTEAARRQRAAATTTARRDSRRSRAHHLGGQTPHQAPSLSQPSPPPSPPYCSDSTRHGYKNKTAMWLRYIYFFIYIYLYIYFFCLFIGGWRSREA